MDLAGLPYVPLRFDKNGAKVSAGGVRPDAAGITDLIVISHGWHQDPDDAEDMYKAMLQQFQTQATAGGLYGNRKFAVTGVYWPSDQFRDDLSSETVAVLGQAAATAGSRDAALPSLKARAKALASVLGLKPKDLVDLATYAVSGGPGDQDAFVAALRAALGPASAVDREMQSEHAEMLSAKPGRAIFQALSMAGSRATAALHAGGAQAAALGLAGSQAPAAGFFSGPIAAVASLLNQAAYFTLKKRAGVVGAGLAQLLEADGALTGVVRLHLVGHSFGARLVTSAASAMTRVKPYSLTMLQGAFSHNGLGVGIASGLDGAFRNVVAERKVDKRIVITHTWNDHAVGVAYAIASRASNDVASGLLRVTDTFGGAKDIHGGMGANGALRLKAGEGTDLPLDGSAVPAFGSELVHSRKCDFIESHSDIRTPQVARVLLGAVA
jgi:hypothetical protein